jgi:hypothetical protein
MTVPRAFGRWLPRNDWEGDDFTPGAHGDFVTCTDTAAGRMLAWATNGRTDLDGRQIRVAIRPRDPDGVTLEQVKRAIFELTSLDLVICRDWQLANVKTHLRYGRGLMIGGRYGALPRAYRHQAFGDFLHRMWVSHMSAATGNVRLWDPLNPDIHAYGRWVPAQAIWDFIATLPEYAYIPLQHV